jgi:two-component system response regulator AtoC
VVALHLPALRERREDIPLLVTHFVERMNARMGLAIVGALPEAMRLLVEYDWPGNVRELENTIERAMVLTESSHLEVDGLPDKVRGLTRPVRKTAAEGHEIPGITGTGSGSGDDGDLSIKRASRRAEEDLIRRALAKTGGNRTRAAELLEISHRALLYKIKEYGIAPARAE